MSLEASSRWGLLPFALVLTVALVLRLGTLTPGRGYGGGAFLRGAVFGLALIVFSIRVLGALGLLHRGVLFGALLVITTALFVVRRDRHVTLPWRDLVTSDTLPVVVVATVATIACIAAAYFLPVWQWDALGYHLPYVDFALQNGTLADVPRDVPYLSTYPHVIEHYFVAWRAMLTDDRLVDAAQIPLGVFGAVSIAVIARQFGARREHAAAAGLLWLTLPAVFLQLPTDYIDVGTAALLLCSGAFVLAPPDPLNLIAAGVALGLLLGSKPNAPVATTILFAVVAARGWKAGRRASIGIAAGCILILGAESYVLNLVRHGNPIWPVRLTLGPIALPGTLPMQALLDSGCAAPRVHGSFLVRIARSWTSLDAPPVFDMRYGGLGLVYVVALPVALLVAWRRRDVALAAVAAAALASPDPVVPRYILAFPGLVLALAAPALSRIERWSRRGILWLVAATATVGLVRAYPGIIGEGPPLGEYIHMTERQRLRAVGADGSPAPFYDALERIRPGDITLFDTSLELPYLAWPPDLSTRAIRIPDDASSADADRFVGDPRVGLLMVDGASAVAVAARKSEQFVEVYRCKPRVPPKCFEIDRGSSASELTIPPTLVESSSCVILARR